MVRLLPPKEGTDTRHQHGMWIDVGSRPQVSSAARLAHHGRSRPHSRHGTFQSARTCAGTNNENGKSHPVMPVGMTSSQLVTCQTKSDWGTSSDARGHRLRCACSRRSQMLRPVPVPVPFEMREA